MTSLAKKNSMDCAQDHVSYVFVNFPSRISCSTRRNSFWKKYGKERCIFNLTEMLANEKKNIFTSIPIQQNTSNAFNLNVQPRKMAIIVQQQIVFSRNIKETLISIDTSLMDIRTDVARCIHTYFLNIYIVFVYSDVYINIICAYICLTYAAKFSNSFLDFIFNMMFLNI